MLSLAVIIPNYNNGKYLEQAISSILSQSRRPDEIIIVDDCSTDDSREVILQLAEQSNVIKPIFLEKNGGVSNARNTGLAAAASEYVTFLDADDFYINEKKLENEMALVEAYRQKGKDIMAYSVTTSVDKNGERIRSRYNLHWKKHQFPTGNVRVRMVSFTRNTRSVRDYCLRRELLQGLGGYTFYKNFYEDLDLLMKIAEAGIEYHCTFELGTAYRLVEGGLSRKSPEEYAATEKEIQDYYFNRLNWIEKIQCRLMQVNYYVWTGIKLNMLVPLRDRLINRGKECGNG